MQLSLARKLDRMLRGPRLHEWLLLAVLLFLTDHYRWMMDDAFIYFRYADNLLYLARGLVYNAGEYVEGFSSPLWMLILLPFRGLGIDFYKIVRVLALVCAAGYGVGLIWVNQRLSPRGPIFNFPLAASATHYGLTTHFSSGLETPLVQCLAPLYAAALMRPASAWLQCAVAAAPLIRPECGLLWAVYLPWVVARTRRIPLWFVASAALWLSALLTLRVTYYADFLPNTFYLKDAAQWAWGWDYLRNVSTTHHWPYVLLGLVVCAWLGRVRLRRTPLGARLCMLCAAVLYAVYVVRVGGDMLYHRYLALPTALLLCAAGGCVEAGAGSILPSRSAGWRSLPALCALSIGACSSLCYPPQLSAHPLTALSTSHKWRNISDAHWHRRHHSLRYNASRADEDVLQRSAYARFRAGGQSEPIKITVQDFCRHAYIRFDEQVVHAYGLTEPVLARIPRRYRWPGHKRVQREARDILELREHAQATAWYETQHAPRWIRRNVAAMRVLDRKIHNQHELVDNLRLAATPLHFR